MSKSDRTHVFVILLAFFAFAFSIPEAAAQVREIEESILEELEKKEG